MERATGARTILALDAAGCAAVAAVAVSLPAATRRVGCSGRSRWAIISALTVTSVLCANGARRTQPRPVDLTLASALNGAWVATCLIVLPRQEDRLGRLLVATTAACDAIAGSIQWVLRPQ